jgi:hypothetical protein
MGLVRQLPSRFDNSLLENTIRMQFPAIADAFTIPGGCAFSGIAPRVPTIPHDERLQSLNSIASVPGLIDFSEPRAPKKNFAPRVGLAWSPGNSSNTSIRAGFGMAYDVLFDNIGILSKPPQLNQTYDCPGSPTCPNTPSSPTEDCRT